MRLSHHEQHRAWLYAFLAQSPTRRPTGWVSDAQRAVGDSTLTTQTYPPVTAGSVKRPDFCDLPFLSSAQQVSPFANIWFSVGSRLIKQLRGGPLDSTCQASSSLSRPVLPDGIIVSSHGPRLSLQRGKRGGGGGGGGGWGAPGPPRGSEGAQGSEGGEQSYCCVHHTSKENQTGFCVQGSLLKVF